MEGAATYHWFAERYGWTPSEVDECPAWLKDRLPTVAAVFDELAEERAKKKG